MATVKRAGSKHRFSWTTFALVLVVAGAAAWWYFGAGLVGNASAATGYGAKTACSCRHIAGRDLSSCEEDFLPGMEFVMLSEDEDEKSVTASVPMIYSQTAHFRDGFGCLLEGHEG